MTEVTGTTRVTRLTRVTGMTRMTGVPRITGVTGVTRETGMTTMTGMTSLTSLTRVTGMTGMTRVTRVTGMIRMTGITGMTGITRVTETFFESFALLMAKFAKLFLTDLFQYCLNKDLPKADHLLIFFLTEFNKVQNGLMFNLTVSKDILMFELTCMTAGGSDQWQYFGCVFNGIVGRLHIYADSYIRFL